MDIELIHYNIQQLLDKLSTQTKPDLSESEIDMFIEKAIYAWLREQTSSLKNKGVELDETQVQKLSTLTVRSPIDQAAITPSQTSGAIYEFASSDLAYDLYHVLRAEAEIADASCTKSASVFFVEHDDLHYLLNDSLHAPSLKWGRVLGLVGKGSGGTGEKSIYLYSDGTFSISNLYLSYIKHPVIPTIGGYNDINSVAKTKTQLDLPEEVHHEIVDKTVELIALSINDPALQSYIYNFKNNQ